MKLKFKISSIKAILLFIWVLVAAAFAISFFGEVSRRFPLFLPGVELFTLVTFILIVVQDDWDKKEVFRTCKALCIVSVLTTIIIGFGGYSRHKVAFEKIFLHGKIRNEDFQYDTDNGEGTGTSYWIETDDTTGREILDWVYFLFVIGGPILTVRIYYKKFSMEKDF